MNWVPVIVESPYSGDVDKNREYLNLALRDCINNGESPYASHRMLTEALDDTKADERALGISAGEAWRTYADYTVFYIDHGWSKGMHSAVLACVHANLPFYSRMIIKPYVRFDRHCWPIETDIQKATARMLTDQPLEIWKQGVRTGEILV